MISIDNSVELMIKTYLGLPKRITGLAISRKEFDEISESFPALLDALEKYASVKLEGVDLGAIEWYHRLRNQLYHQGNGLTVERDKVDVYAQLANVLFKNLFGSDLIEDFPKAANLLGEFIESWATLEKRLNEASPPTSAARAMLGVPYIVMDLRKADLLKAEDVARFDALRKIRNEIVHGAVDHKAILTPARIRELKDLIERVSKSTGASAAGAGPAL